MSLINKYRPRKFSEVVGQDKVVKNLTNQLKKGKLHNAYLFAGKYGIGKTTLARLLAKAINCENFEDDICGKCENCKNNDNSFDIKELDAASNRGIDEIRKLKNNSNLIPFNLKYKVYIIDEAHQLTSQASNAFLKTLEEPSSRTKFIFCTTKPWKLLSTIRSRCLPFYLETIRYRDIKNRLAYIVKQEDIAIQDERILYTIARNSNNTMRDAINLLEVCLNNCDGKITQPIIEDSLNLVSEKDVYSLLEYLMYDNTEKFFNKLHKVASSGKKYEDIISTLKHQVRDILFVKKGYTKNINKYKKKKIKELNYQNSDLIKLLGNLVQVEGKISNYINPKDISEFMFLKFLHK